MFAVYRRDRPFSPTDRCVLFLRYHNVEQVTEDEEENTVSMSFDGSSTKADGFIKISSPSDPRVVLFFRQVKRHLQARYYRGKITHLKIMSEKIIEEQN